MFAMKRLQITLFKDAETIICLLLTPSKRQKLNMHITKHLFAFGKETRIDETAKETNELMLSPLIGKLYISKFFVLNNAVTL